MELGSARAQTHCNWEEWQAGHQQKAVVVVELRTWEPLSDLEAFESSRCGNKKQEPGWIQQPRTQSCQSPEAALVPSAKQGSRRTGTVAPSGQSKGRAGRNLPPSQTKPNKPHPCPRAVHEPGSAWQQSEYLSITHLSCYQARGHLVSELKSLGSAHAEGGVRDLQPARDSEAPSSSRKHLPHS